MAKLPPRKRPQYSPQERMAILELRARKAITLRRGAGPVFLGVLRSGLGGISIHVSYRLGIFALRVGEKGLSGP